MNGEHKIGGGAGPSVRLLTAADMRGRLKVSERKFHELRATGVVPAPLELGPRAPRWTEDDYAETVRRLPRRESGGEPARLAAGRRRRIERMKAGAPAAPARDRDASA